MMVRVIIDIEAERKESEFLTKYQYRMRTFKDAITEFERHFRDYIVFHMSVETANNLGYFERDDCLIFGGVKRI